MPATKNKGKPKAIAVDDRVEASPLKTRSQRGKVMAEKDKTTGVSSKGSSVDAITSKETAKSKSLKQKNGAYKNSADHNQGDVIESQSDDDEDELDDAAKDVKVKKATGKSKEIVKDDSSKPTGRRLKKTAALEKDDEVPDEEALDVKPKRRVAKKASSQDEPDQSEASVKDKPEVVKPKERGSKKTVSHDKVEYISDGEDYSLATKSEDEVDEKDFKDVKQKKRGAKKALSKDEESVKPRGRGAKKAAANLDVDNDTEDDEVLAVPSTSKQFVTKDEDIKPKKRGSKKTDDDQPKPKSSKVTLQDSEDLPKKRGSKKDLKVDEEPVDLKPKKTTSKKAADSDEDEEATVPKKAKKNIQAKDNSVDKKKGAAKKTSKSANAPQADEEVKMKTLKWRGKAPVDEECKEKINSSHVYYEEDEIYYTMLNQTNLQNNNNKFYLIEILEDNDRRNYSVWMRWGRVGLRGQTSLKNYGANLDQAKAAFEGKFKEKTKNDWCERHFFQKYDGKYELLTMDFSADNDEPVKEVKDEKPPKDIPKSKLESRLQSFIELIFNIKAMEATVLEMKYNAKKAPLGKLTVEQVTAGYAALNEIEHCITNNITGKELVEACNSFYTKIPHDFGMKRPPLIQTTEELKAKIELLKTLGDIQVAMSILNETVDALNNPIDSHYNSLHCELKPIEKESEIFQMVDEYLQNTHAATHQLYKLELVDLFDCDRENEEKKYKDVGNRMLLWHGSRLTNAPGILKQGLRIAPPEAPSTGYMFGKGVYFADMSSKSANYCYTTRNQNEGVLYLCEVAVGTSRKLTDADYNAGNLPAGFHSVLGQGTVMPDPKMTKNLPNGTIVPLGKSVPSGVSRGYLNYNEYIVYDVDQIKLKYVLRVKFLYK